MNDSRPVVSWRIVSVWPTSPRMTSWLATIPGKRTEWMGGSPARRLCHQPRRARRRSAGGVQLAVVVELDYLGLLHVLRSLHGKAHHQNRADREVGRHEHVGGRAPGSLSRDCARLLAERVDVEARGADHHVYPCSHALQRVSERHVRAREVDDDLGLALCEHLLEVSSRATGPP